VASVVVVVGNRIQSQTGTERHDRPRCRTKKTRSTEIAHRLRRRRLVRGAKAMAVVAPAGSGRMDVVLTGRGLRVAGESRVLRVVNRVPAMKLMETGAMATAPRVAADRVGKMPRRSVPHPSTRLMETVHHRETAGAAVAGRKGRAAVQLLEASRLVRAVQGRARSLVSNRQGRLV
jgi:hypothetical protein